MITKELLDYIKIKKDEKIDEESIKNSLYQMGWRESDITFGMKVYENTEVPVPPYETEKSRGGYKDMWDAFLHVLLFISMYVIVLALINIIFNTIDLYFPYRINYPSYEVIGSPRNKFINKSKESFAWLVVATPIYLFLFSHINERTEKNPELKNLPSRKKLIYLTLVVTFVTMLISIFIVINRILDASINLNLLLKLVFLVTISATIFYYYLGQVREDRTVKL